MKSKKWAEALPDQLSNRIVLWPVSSLLTPTYEQFNMTKHYIRTNELYFSSVFFFFIIPLFVSFLSFPSQLYLLLFSVS